MENKRSKGTTALIVALLLVTIASLILATFAWARYYTGTTTENAVAQVAKWNVTVSDTKNFVQSYSHVLGDRIAPGTNGSLTANITIGADTEVDAQYEVTIDEFIVEKVGSWEGTARIPENMVFKNASDAVIKHEDLKKGTVLFTGTSTAGTAKTLNQVVLKWDWPYQTEGNVTGNLYTNGLTNATILDSDEVDTFDGEHPVKITVKYKIHVWQQQPTNP